MHIYKSLILLFLFSGLTYGVEMRCQADWDNLKAIQTKMRHGDNSESTRDRERKLHSIYQQCRMGKTDKISPQKSSPLKQQSSNHRRKVYYSNAKNPFQDAKVAVKGRYEGEKQKAWVDYYRAPPECKKPKSTSAFAKCMAHRDEVSKEFDKKWADHIKPFKLD